MNLTDFNSLKIGDIVQVVCNTGSTGISPYQYIGIFKDHETKEAKHVFLSKYFLSTVCPVVGRESRSISIKKMFLTEREAIKYRNKLRDDEEGILEYFK